MMPNKSPEQPALVFSVPLSQFTPQAGDGSVFYVEKLSDNLSQKM
jgi:hypothetical protein